MAAANPAIPDRRARASGENGGQAMGPGSTAGTPARGQSPASNSAKARRRNVLSTFLVPDAARIAGRNVLVVDDVLTTGATADATARALKRAGAREVRILALARVVRAAEGLI